MKTRRDFLTMTALAAAGCVTRGLKTGAQFSGWAKGHFQIHFIYTGAGESMFLIFPDGTTMLLDCGDFDAGGRGDLALPLLPDASLHAGEWTARYVKRVNPNSDNVDYMLISHFHRDHMGTCQWCKDVVRRGNRDYCLSGFSLAAETLHFRTAIDRTGGTFDERELFEPSENHLPYLLDCLYGHLKARDGLVVEKLRLGATDQIVCRKGGATGFSVKNICANGRFALVDGSVLDTLRPHGRMPWYWNENHLSCGHVFTYGKFRFFTAGDVSGPAMDDRGVTFYPEKDLAKTLTGPVAVAKCDHHAFKSMPDELLRALRAKVYPLCAWDVLHGTDDALARLADWNNYPGERLVVPGCFGAARMTSANAASRRALFPEAIYSGVHTVIDVPPGGETFALTLLDARDEDMRVVYERCFPVSSSATGSNASCHQAQVNSRAVSSPEVLLEVGPSETVARASEGDLIVLKDGRWLLGYSEFPAKQSGRYAAHHDHAKSRIVTRVSSDAGRTWSEPVAAVEPEAGDLNVMSVSFLRLKNGRLALFYVRKRAESDGRPAMRVSADEGKTWSPARDCVDEAHRDYYVLNNARAVRLSTGRIILPLCRHSVDAGDPQGFESEGRLCVAASDDDGASWRMICEPFKVFDRLRSRVTVQEPGIVELKDGRLLMYARTNRRAQWGLWSSDGGATWSRAEPLPLVSPNLAPATITRLKDGNLVAVWNDYSKKSTDPERMAFAEQREPFSIAWSKDEGRTWSPSRTIEADPPGSRPNLYCCYFAVREIGDALCVFHCHHNGLRISHLTKIPLSWVYAPSDL